jgi:acetylornithine aminotransferase
MNNNIIPLYPTSTKRLDRSAGCYQYDTDGKEYIDFEAGVWCANLGHSHHRIVSVINQQAPISIHHGYRFGNVNSEKLAVQLQRLMGFNDGASVFLSSGSEAVNLSITMAQRLTGKKKILKISNSYLSAFGTGQITPDNEAIVNIPFNDLAGIDQIDFREIAAFVLETGGASVEMVRFPDESFVKKMIDEALQHGLFIIADEVTTGFGRLGKWFGFQYYDIMPDMVVTGKALGNGYPVSAVTVNANVLHQLKNNPFVYAQSHQNDPLGCAIGLEVIKVFEEEQILENCNHMGNYFRQQLEDLCNANTDKIKECRAKGLMLALEFQETFDAKCIDEALFESGFVFSFKQNTLRFLPPLTITQYEIDKLIERLKELI